MWCIDGTVWRGGPCHPTGGDCGKNAGDHRAWDDWYDGAGICPFLGATRIIAVSTSEEKLKMAEELGADFGINSRTQDVVQAVREATDGIGADRVIEMTGVVRFFNLAIDMLAPAGRLVCVGNYNEDVVIPNYQMRVMNKELTITGIFGRRMFETWELAKELVVSGHVKLERFIGEIMPLTDFDRGAKIAPKTFGRIVYLP